MLILLAFALALALGGYLLSREVFEVPGIVLLMVGLLGLGVGTLLIPISHYEARSQMRQVESLRSTLATARLRGESVENAALQMKIVEANQWIASAQYANETMFDAWMPDAVDTLEPVR